MGATKLKSMAEIREMIGAFDFRARTSSDTEPGWAEIWKLSQRISKHAYRRMMVFRKQRWMKEYKIRVEKRKVKTRAKVRKAKP